MLEHDTPPAVKPASPEARFYLERISNLVQMRTYIDRGEFTNATHKGVPLYPDFIQKDNLDLQPTNYGKGLSFGVSHAILGTRRILDRMGYGSVADEILTLHRNYQREEQQKSQQQQ